MVNILRYEPISQTLNLPKHHQQNRQISQKRQKRKYASAEAVREIQYTSRNVQLQKKREKARLAARRMRGGKYYAPSSQEDSQSIPAEPSREETHSPVRTDSLAESKTERSGSITSSRRLFSIQPETSLHQDYQGNQILMPSQLQKVHKWMMETHQGLVGFVEEMLLDQSDAAHQDAMFLPLLSTPRKTCQSQAATIQSQGDEKLV